MAVELSHIDIIKRVRSDPSVQELQRLDPKTEISLFELNQEAIDLFNQEYPQIFSEDYSRIYSVNVVSSKMIQKNTYKKIRFYITPEGFIVKKIES